MINIYQIKSVISVYLQTTEPVLLEDARTMCIHQAEGALEKAFTLVGGHLYNIIISARQPTAAAGGPWQSPWQPVAARTPPVMSRARTRSSSVQER